MLVWGMEGGGVLSLPARSLNHGSVVLSVIGPTRPKCFMPAHVIVRVVDVFGALAGVSQASERTRSPSPGAVLSSMKTSKSLHSVHQMMESESSSDHVCASPCSHRLANKLHDCVFAFQGCGGLLCVARRLRLRMCCRRVPGSCRGVCSLL